MLVKQRKEREQSHRSKCAWPYETVTTVSPHPQCGHEVALRVLLMVPVFTYTGQGQDAQTLNSQCHSERFSLPLERQHRVRKTKPRVSGTQLDYFLHVQNQLQCGISLLLREKIKPACGFISQFRL